MTPKPAPTPKTAKAVPPRKLVVLEEGTLQTMALNPNIVKEFPFLVVLTQVTRATGRAGCGTCGKANAERGKAFTKVKQTIAGLDSDKKRRLKELLNTKSARVVYPKANGKGEELTF